jgi:hypothetical protein
VHTWLDWQTSKTVNPDKPHIPNLHTVFRGIKLILIVESWNRQDLQFIARRLGRKRSVRSIAFATPEKQHKQYLHLSNLWHHVTDEDEKLEWQLWYHEG